MTPQSQTTIGITGDCYRTCIACLLDIPVADVPHVFEDARLSTAAGLALMDDWLGARGLARMCFPLTGDLDTLLTMMGRFNPRAYYQLLGDGGRGLNHVAIYRGGELAHDPLDGAKGIIGPANDGNFWVEFIVPKRLA